MNLQFYLEKLNDMEVFKKFSDENSEAYLCSGFFVRDFENLKNPSNESHIDFFLPSKNKIISFDLNEGVNKEMVNPFQGSPSKLIGNSEIDFEEVEDKIMKKMSEEGVKNRIQRIFLSFQNKDSRDFILCTIFISGLGMIKMTFDDGGKVIDFKKDSLWSMINVLKKKARDRKV